MKVELLQLIIRKIERLTALRNHGMSSQLSDITNPLAYDPNGIKNPWFYEMHEVGFNYRSSDINCALGLSQLKKVDSFVSRRKIS